MTDLTTQTKHRPIAQIADEIFKDWLTMPNSAKAYARSMRQIWDIEGMFYQDTKASVVRYFLSNAGTWRGPVARRIKAELNTIIKGRD
jgi:hypothetical protein